MAKNDPRSVQSLVRWLRAKPKEKRYHYFDAKDCLGAQYCRAHGLIYSIPHDMPDNNKMPRKKDSFEIKLEWAAQADEMTFGAALKRARKLAA